MKKKVIASILAMLLAVQPVSASEMMFSDGTQQVEEFSSEPEENSTGELLAESTQQIGDNVWVTFEGDTATISGTGEMWDFFENGWDLNNEHQNPFECYQNIENIHNIIIGNGITNVSDYLLRKCSGFYDSPIKKIQIGEDVKHIGKYAFEGCNNVEPIILPEGLEIVDEYGFAHCKIQFFPSNLKKLGDYAFWNCKFENPDAVEIIGSFTEIPGNCFESTNLTSIKLGENITVIGNSAFSYCEDLTNVDLPENLMKIGNDAFFYSGITSIKIPAGVSEVGASAFSECKALSTVEFEGENLVEITRSMFSDCTNLYSIKIPNGVQVIYYRAFGGCVRLREITIPSSVTSIDNEAFEGCENLAKIKGYTGSYAEQYAQENNILFESIGTVTVPSLKGISMEWTGPDSAKVVCVSDKNGWYCADWVTRGSEAPEFDFMQDGVAIRANQQFTIYFNGLDSEHDIDIYVRVKDVNNVLSQNLIFMLDGDKRPGNINNIQVGDNVYASIEGDTLTISGSGATYDCDWTWHWYRGDKTQISKVKFEGNINYIGDYFFYGFDSVKEIILPEGITGLGKAVFCHCDGLEKITFPSTLIEIPTIAFCEDFGVGLENLKTVIIPEGVQRLGEYAFKGCTALETITLPESIKSIGDRAFEECSSLKEITLPEGLTVLGNYVFNYCQDLRKISFPSTLETIPQPTVDAGGGELINLEDVVIPEGVKNISFSAFACCSKLKHVNFPNSIESIGDLAFSYSGLESFVVPEKHINWGNSVFEHTSLTSVIWNANNPIIPDSMFYGCDNLKNITIEEGVTAINTAAFSGCTSLTSVSVPERVTELGDSVFSGCSNLKKISIPETVKYFGKDVFYNCRNLTIYGYKDSAAERYAINNDIPFVSADYKVVFKNNGRTVKTEYVLAGGNATPPTLDPREGYTLSWDGDYTDIREDMIINAVWTKDDDGEPPVVYPPETTKYTVTFKDRGKVIKTEKVPSGDAADYPFIYRYGYELSWDKDFSKVTSNMTVNAVWTVIKPSKVTSFTAEVLPKYIRLSWDETEYTGYYLVYRKADSEKEYKQVAKLTGILWSDKQVKPDTGYSYKVIAVRSVEGKKYQSPESDIVKGKIETPKKGKIYSVGKLNYKVMSSTEVSVTGVAKVTGTISVPATVTIIGKVFKVTSVADEAFTGNLDIINVRFGNNVKDIGRLAFYKCANLEEVRFGKNVMYIRDGAFSRCEKLGNTLLPQNVRRIGTRAFYKCVSMNTLVINTTRLEYLGKNALAIRPKVVIKVPASKYSLYKKRITQTGIYSGTQITKI